MTTAEKDICPMLSTPYVPAKCIGDKCAWWGDLDSACAIWLIYHKLRHILNEVRR